MASYQQKIQTIRNRRDSSLASIQPPIPDIPLKLPQNVTALPAQLLTSSEVAITENSVEQLLELLASGRLTAVEVTRAFLRRAAVAQKLVNCVTELLPSLASERAEALDRYYAEHKRPIGPLHGLPISTKEHLNLKGWESNFSFVSRVGEIAETNGLLLEALYNAGAIFYARTTQPQTLMHLDTSSELYGTTVNPYNLALTAGGSSGGEGALIALRGSVLGIGSDTGGSIRQPAGVNGIYGFKPSSSRLTLYGLSFLCPGRDQVPSVVGPMSTSLHGIELFMKVAVDAASWNVDQSLPPLKWRDDVDWLKRRNGRRRLKIGVMWDDGIITPHPPVRRALKETVEKLKMHEDIEIIDWKPYDHELGVEIWNQLLFADNGELMLGLLEKVQEPMRPLTRWIFRENRFVRHRTLEEMWECLGKRDKYRADYARVWNETAGNTTAGDFDQRMDVILTPVYPGGPAPLDESKYWSYTTIWNILDYPGIVFPVTTASAEKDPKDKYFQPKNKEDKANQELYCPTLYDGVPISLQLVGRRWEDEKVLQAMRFIQERIDGGGNGAKHRVDSL